MPQTMTERRSEMRRSQLCGPVTPAPDPVGSSTQPQPRRCIRKHSCSVQTCMGAADQAYAQLDEALDI